MRSQGRIARGWRLAKDSWAVLRSDRSLALFPLVGFAGSVISLAVILAPGIGLAAAADGWWPVVPFALVALYASSFATIYAGVGLAAATAQVMDRGEVTLADGLRAARARRGIIARWALVQASVGLLLHVIQAVADNGNALTRILGTIVVSIVGAAWSVATFFVVPLLAFEEVGPKEALQRSIGLIRERWGEGVVGTASIGAVVFLLGTLPSALVIALGIALGGPAGVAIAAVGVLGVAASIVIDTALSAIFRVALYRFATADQAAAGFEQADLAGAFAPRRSRR